MLAVVFLVIVIVTVI